MRHSPTLSPLACALLAVGLLTPAATVLAQATGESKPANDTQTIVVTAQKRSQSIKDVPLAVTAISGDRLEAQGIRDVADLAKVAPSLEFGVSTAAGQGASPSIRGIGTSVFTTSAETSVGVVVDGVPLGNTSSGVLLDLERVEVLRGPQGTLFGKSASAGVLNLTTRSPELKLFEGFGAVELSGGEVKGSTVRLALNAPLGDSSALRVAGSTSQSKGINHNTLSGEDRKSQVDGLRLRYLYRHSRDLSVNLIGEYSKSTDENAVFFAPFASDAATAASFAACGVTISPDNNQVCSDGPEKRQTAVQGFSAQLDWTLGNQLSLTSISALRKLEAGPNFVAVDMSNYPTRIRSSDARNDLKQFSQELRLASRADAELEWTAGLFFSDYEGRKDEVTTVLPDPAAPSPPVPRQIRSNPKTDTDIRSAAAFGQATYKLNPAFSVLFGLRHTRDTVSETQTLDGAVQFAGFAPPPTVKTATGKAKESDTSGKLGLLWAVDPLTRAYFTVTRGYKAPQIDTSSPIAGLATSGSATGIIIGAERPTTVELGVKGQFLNRQLDADVAVFQSDVKDYQEQSCTINATGSLACVPINVPDVKTSGLEFDARARLFDGLSVTAGGALILGAEYPSGYKFGADDIGGKRLLFSSKGKLVLGVEYLSTALKGWDWTIGGDVTYKTAVRYCNSPVPECTFGAHTVTSLRTSLHSEDDRYHFSLFVRNLGDERVPGSILTPIPGKSSGAAHLLSAASFRSYGVTGEIRF